MISSARNPNESYADRAKKASTSSNTRATQQNHLQHATNALPSSSLKPPQVSVWAERIKEQQAHSVPQPTQMSRQRATSSPQPQRDEPIQPRSPPPDLSAQLSILDQKDEHDPFIVRVPPHLSRQSSSSTNPLPAADPTTWPLLPGTASHSNASSASYDSPFLSAPPSRQNSTASVRHRAYSGSGSSSQVQVPLPQHSRSASRSRVQSRSGSSDSSPRLQIRGRTLPPDDPLLPDLRLDDQQRRSSKKRSSPTLPDPPSRISPSFQIDPPADPLYYRHPPVPPSQDMPPRYTHNVLSQYAPLPHFLPTHVPGHTSPPYVPHSSQGTPPFPPFPPFPAYMYGHPPFFWGDIPSHNHFHNQPSIHADTSDRAVSHKIEFGSVSPVITAESGTAKDPVQSQDTRPSKAVVFGTINPTDFQDDATVLLPSEGQRPDTTVEHTTEQFAAFSIGLSPNEPGPSRYASRKSSVKSLSKVPSVQPTTNDGTTDPNVSSPPLREVNGIKKPVKWEFGTTHSEDLNDPQPPSPHSSLPAPPPTHRSEHADSQLGSLNLPPAQGASHADRSLEHSETASTTSDVWIVKDFGYGFGDHSGSGNAPEVVRWEMHERERERERVREGHREREMFRDQYRDRGWVPARHGWRQENGTEEGREGWEQQVHVDVPRHMRIRRGSFSGYGGHDRGNFPPRRGRGFGGRFHGGRGRGGFFHHQRPGSYPYVPPPPPPFEVLPPPMDALNGYGSYAPPEPEPYEAGPPPLQQRVPFTPAYSVEVMRNCLLAQLEYYLSPQNMAQDFFLRQRMDNEGWIPISLLASFKRVQQLQTDADIVREVLSRSAVVEVNGDLVRMGGRQWELFVLPNAPRSMVTGVDRGEGKIPMAPPAHKASAYVEHGGTEGENGEIEGDYDGEDCEGDDEDDDIEFVIGEEAEGSWMVPERKQ